MDRNRKDLNPDQVEAAKKDLVRTYPQTFNYYNYDECFPNSKYASVSSLVDTNGRGMVVINTAGDTYEDVLEKSKDVIKSINSAIPMSIVKMGQWFPVNVNAAHIKDVKKHVVSGSDDTSNYGDFKKDDVEKAILGTDAKYLAADEKKMEEVKRNAKKQTEWMKTKLKEETLSDDNELESLCVDITKLNEIYTKIDTLSKTLVNLAKRAKLLGAIHSDKRKRNPDWYQYFKKTYVDYGYRDEDIKTLEDLDKLVVFSSSLGDTLTLNINIDVESSELSELKKHYIALTLETLESS